MDGDVVEGESAVNQVRRTDTEEIVGVTYHVGDVSDGGPAFGNLEQTIEGTASEEDRGLYADVWHGRVERALSDDSLFTVTTVDP